MRSILLAALVLAPAAALSQSIELQVAQAETVTYGGNDCGTTIPVTWTLTSVIPCSDFKVWLTTGDCGDTPGSGEKVVRTEPQANVPAMGSFTFNVSDLPLFTAADAGVACGATQTQVAYKVCGSVKYQGVGAFDCSTSNAFARESTPPTITYDSQPPSPPAITDVEPLDSALAAALTVDNDTQIVRVEARVPGTGEVVSSSSRAAPFAAVRVPDLQNGVEYELVATAEDAAGNVSDPSAPHLGTPVKVLGFGEAYKNAGGQLGGCSAGGATVAGWCAILLAVGFLWRRRSWR